MEDLKQIQERDLIIHVENLTRQVLSLKIQVEQNSKAIPSSFFTRWFSILSVIAIITAAILLVIAIEFRPLAENIANIADVIERSGGVQIER